VVIKVGEDFEEGFGRELENCSIRVRYGLKLRGTEIRSLSPVWACGVRWVAARVEATAAGLCLGGIVIARGARNLEQAKGFTDRIFFDRSSPRTITRSAHHPPTSVLRPHSNCHTSSARRQRNEGTSCKMLQSRRKPGSAEPDPPLAEVRSSIGRRRSRLLGSHPPNTQHPHPSPTDLTPRSRFFCYSAISGPSL